jgi:predicted RecB family endonuclease
MDASDVRTWQAGYPGKLEFGAADQRLRRALSRLARDPDPDARQEGARIAEEAIEALHALAARADEASTATKRVKAQTERLRQRLDAQLERLQRRGGGH